MKKIYYKSIYVVLNLLIVYGVVCPYLISVANNELVLLGLALVVADITHITFFIINNLKKFKHEKK